MANLECVVKMASLFNVNTVEVASKKTRQDSAMMISNSQENTIKLSVSLSGIVEPILTVRLESASLGCQGTHLKQDCTVKTRKKDKGRKMSIEKKNQCLLARV